MTVRTPKTSQKTAVLRQFDVKETILSFQLTENPCFSECAEYQYGTRKRLRSVLLARHMYDCIVSNYAGLHGVNTIERRYGTIVRIVSTLTSAAAEGI